MIKSTIRAAVTAACLIGMTNFVSLAASALKECGSQGHGRTAL